MASIRSRILQNLQATVEAIDKADVYHFDWLNAYTRTRPIPEFKGYPSCNLSDAGQNYVDGASFCTHKSWSVRIDAAHRVVEEDGDDGQTVADQLLEDLERALLVDPTRGGLAVDTRLTNARTSQPAAMAPTVVASLTFLVTYRTQYGNPDLPR